MAIKGVVHQALLRTTGASDLPVMRRFWSSAIRRANNRWGSDTISVALHGQRAKINFANPYPLAVRRFPNYNAAQVELIASTSAAVGRRVNVIDVGAAIGDTALLILERCADAIQRLDCVEGDPTFIEYLRANLNRPQVTIHQAMLSDAPGPIAALVRSQHQGTASAHGSDSVNATTLDELFSDASPDVLKVDTDGYDGTILAGGKRLLDRARPAVLFEWHPKLCELVGADPLRAFEVLREAGYDRWVFFTKFGQFSHFGDGNLDELTRLCLTSETLDDWHYDVVALHPTSTIDEVELADLRRWGSSGW